MVRSQEHKDYRARKKQVIALLRRLRAGEITNEGYFKGMLDIYGPETVRCLIANDPLISRMRNKIS